MKRVIISLLLLATGGQLHAEVRAETGGVGEALLFPFFSVRHGFATLINVQNHHPLGKALKVRVTEADQSVETLTFNVYVPGNTRWSAALTLADEAFETPAALRSAGGGCTVPALDTPTPLSVARMPFHPWPMRTRRGTVEVIEMGVMSDALTMAASSGGCDVFGQRFEIGGVWSTSPNADLTAPVGGLRGDAILINVPGGTSFGYPAIAFNGVSNGPRQFALEGSGADELSPRLVDVEADQDGIIKVSVQRVRDGRPQRVTLRYPAFRSHEAISALLASAAAQGNYDVSPELASRSEWVLSFPTRRAHKIFDAGAFAPPPLGRPAPFESGTEVDMFSITARGRDGQTTPAYVQRPEQFLSDMLVLKPSRDTTGNEVRNPLFFTYLIPGALVFLAADTGELTQLPDSSGTLTLDFTSLPNGSQRMSAADLDGHCYIGLPVWVWQVQAYDNDNAQPGRVATYPDARTPPSSFDVVDC
jgi:hypothetical protein